MICKYCNKEMWLEESSEDYSGEYGYYICEDENCGSSCWVSYWIGGDCTEEWEKGE